MSGSHWCVWVLSTFPCLVPARIMYVVLLVIPCAPWRRRSKGGRTEAMPRAGIRTTQPGRNHPYLLWLLPLAGYYRNSRGTSAGERLENAGFFSSAAILRGLLQTNLLCDPFCWKAIGSHAQKRQMLRRVLTAVAHGCTLLHWVQRGCGDSMQFP